MSALSTTLSLTRPQLPQGSKLLPLTRNLFALVDETLYAALAEYPWAAHPTNAGGFYARRTITVGGHRRSVWMHRQITQAPENLRIDHRSGDGLDNRLSNLRICTATQNAQNARPRLGTSNFKGVGWHKGHKRWVARIRVDGRLLQIGSFVDETEAARAYDAAALTEFGAFARVNFP